MVNKFNIQVSHGEETNSFVCSTRREFLTRVFQCYNIRTTDMVLIDKKTHKEITIDDINDQMHLEIRRQPRINGQQVSEVSPVRVPVKDDIVTKLKENRVLTGLERQFLVKLLDDHYDNYENPPSLKRKRHDRNDAVQVSNKKVQVSPDQLNVLRSYQTQTDELGKHVADDVRKPSTSKDLNYESKRLALEEKRNPEKVFKIMTDTFDSRRNFILLQNPVIKLVQEKYPLLFSLSEVRNELNRIFYDGKDVEFLSNVEKYADAVLGLVDEDDPLLKTVNEKVQNLITPVQKKYAKEVGALLMISNLLREKRVLFLDTEDEPCTSSKYPRIEAPCKVKKLFHDLQIYKIIVEEQLLCEASDFKEAVLCLLASFFIFNISYPAEAFNTLVVMEKVFLEANDTPENDIDDQTRQIMKLIQLKTIAKE